MESTPSSSPLVDQQQNTPMASNKLTPEQEEEQKLRSKYPNPQKPGGSSFIQKMLHKGNKKYFDSGDYNMAKSRCKANGNKTIQTTTINTANNAGDSSSSNSSLNESPSVDSPPASTVTSTSTSSTTSTTTTTTTSTHSINPSTPSIDHNNTNVQHHVHHHHHHQQMNVNTPCQLNSPLTSNINIVNGQYGHHSQAPTSPSVNYLNVNSYHHPSMSSSISASSLMTQSLSQDKLSNIHLNTSLTNVILDSEEIGHGIPTPECIQSRKHSIAQSKLATPRLSTS